MKTWTRAGLERFCGNCHRRIRTGEVYCLWRIVGVKSDKVRCQDCAGEPAPTLPVPRKPAAVSAMRRFGFLPLDEGRDPGQEG
jgi:hypothetical protein